MGTVALRANEDVSGLALVTERQPPSYDAYRAYVAGIDLFFHRRFPEAIRELERAWAADSTFLSPGIWIASAFSNLGDPARRDSVVGLLTTHRGELSQAERAALDIFRADSRGDLQTAYRIAREANRRRESTEGRLMLGMYAFQTNRPREAVSALRAEPRSGKTREGWIGFHATLTGALHILAEYEDEIQAAREARVRFPEDRRPVYWEARALIGLGRIPGAMSVLEEGMSLSSREWSPGNLLVLTGLQLRSHGHDEDGEQALRRGLAWYREEDRSTDDRFSIAKTCLWLGESELAGQLFRELETEKPDVLDYKGYLGLALASAGLAAEAREIDHRLGSWSDPYAHGRHLFWRAAIAARLEEKDRAVDLLRESLAQGLPFPFLFENEDLRPLWGYPSFERLLEPRG
jgi:tetratricopeptide (TPR) repeat protein